MPDARGLRAAEKVHKFGYAAESRRSFVVADQVAVGLRCYPHRRLAFRLNRKLR